MAKRGRKPWVCPAGAVALLQTEPTSLATAGQCVQAIDIDREIADLARQWRLVRGRQDLRWWCGYYLASLEDWVSSSCALHDDLMAVWATIVDPVRLRAQRYCTLRTWTGARPQPLFEVRAAPRGHAKSTLWGFATVLHCALYQLKRYIIIKEAAEELAEQALERIRLALESERIKADYGTLLDSKHTSQERLILLNGSRIDVLGMATTTRGRIHRGARPDLIVLDDVQKNEHVYSETTRERHRRHLNTEVVKSGDPVRCDYLFIGTVLHSDCLIATTLNNPGWKKRGNGRLGPDGPAIYQAVTGWPVNEELWQQWRRIFTDLENENNVEDAYRFYLQHEEAMLEGVQVLWPEYQPFYKLMVERVMLGEAAFSSEMQNIPRAMDDLLFDVERFTFFDPDEVSVETDYQRFVGYWDPSVGVEDAKAQEHGQRDWAAWVVLGLHRTGCVDVLDVRVSKAEVEEQIQTWWDLDQLWWCDQWGVEANAFQKVIFPLHKRMFEAENEKRRKLEAEELIPPTWRPIENFKNKVMRVTRLQGPLHNGQIRIVREVSADMRTFLQMFADFPSAHMLDGPDALEAGYRMIQPRRRPFDEWAGKGQDIKQEKEPLRAASEDAGTAVALKPPETDVGLPDLEEQQRKHLAALFRASVAGVKLPRGYGGKYG